MKTKLIESKPCEGLKNATHIDVEVHYNKGGLNFAGGSSRRGYYINVTPTTHRNGMVSFELFSGVSELLMQTNRYSEKQFEKAVEMAKAVTPEFIQRALDKQKAA